MTLDLPYLTFCPPHPYTIPPKEGYYGIPRHWPSAIEIDSAATQTLKKVSKEVEKEFTTVFNETLVEHGRKNEKVDNAFRVVSDKTVIYNYFDFDANEKTSENPERIYIGHCFEEAPLDKEWTKKIQTHQVRLLVTLGTFLSNRVDVLEKIIKACKAYDPDALIIVSAGGNVGKLDAYSSSTVIIEEFVPQIALMPYMDAVIFHGGCNTFTEAMYYGKPMIILPFSSDQFNISYDAERYQLAPILDPNHFKEEELVYSLKEIMQKSNKQLAKWQEISKERGADYAAKRIMVSNKKNF